MARTHGRATPVAPKAYTPSRGTFAGQTFSSAWQYRNALARKQGYPSYSAQRRAPRPVRTEAALRELTPTQHLARHQSLEALGYMRREGWTLERAAHRAHTTPNAVLRYAGPALAKNARGRYTARPYDRLLRTVQIPTLQGLESVDTYDSRTASRVHDYWDAVERFKAGEMTAMRPFKGKSFQAGGKRYEFITDPATLKRLGNAGHLHFEGPLSG